VIRTVLWIWKIWTTQNSFTKIYWKSKRIIADKKEVYVII